MIAQIFLSLVFILAAGIKSERMSNPQTTRLLATCPVGKYAKGSGCVTCKTGCSIARAVVHPQADNRMITRSPRAVMLSIYPARSVSAHHPHSA